MNLTIVTEHYPPEFGGVATSSRRIANALVGGGHRVQILTFDRTLPVESADRVTTRMEQDVEVHRIGPFHVSYPISHKQRSMFRQRACAQMTRIANAFEPDAFLAFYLLNAGFITRFVATGLNRPYFVSVRGNDISLDAFNTERFATLRWTLEGAAGIACVSEHLQRRVMTVVPNLPPPVVITNGVASINVKENLRLDDGLVVVFIGTLREKKGIRTLLTAMRLLADQTSVRVRVIGPEIGTAERRIAGSAWDQLCQTGRLDCTGEVPREDVAQWAAGGDVVVMPSIDDGMPNGLLEGMAMGLCPVASAIFSDVIRDGENGLLFDPSDAYELAAVLRRLAGDRALVRHLGEAARRYVCEHHRPEVEAAAYERLIVSSTRSAAVAAPSIDIDS